MPIGPPDCHAGRWGGHGFGHSEKGQILQWVNEGGQSLVPSGSMAVRETQAQSSIHSDGSFRVPLPRLGTFHFVFRHSQGSEAEVEVHQVEDTGEVEVRIVIQGHVGNLVEKIHINPAGKADLMGRVKNPNAGPNQCERDKRSEPGELDFSFPKR